VDCGKVLLMHGFDYTPRMDGCRHGLVDAYAFHVSADGRAWTSAGEGEFGNIAANPVRQRVTFPNPVKARYFRFTATRALAGAGSDRVAVAEIDKHTVNVSAVNGSVSGAGNYDYGSIVTLAAVPADHYHFVRWRDGNTTNPRTLTLTQDTSLVAEFEIDKHHISVSAVNGQVQGDGIYDYGQVITLTAVPNVHYHFADWQDNHSSDNPRSVVVERDFTYIANFAPDAYILTVHAEHGTISGAGDHLYGELFTISATPMDHYHFVRWSDGNVSNPRTMTLDKDSTITAVFVLDRHTVTATMNNGTVLGTGEYEYGTNITLTAVPNEHYHFVEWQDNHDTNPTRGITVTGSMNLVAIAAGDVHTITASATHGTIIGGGEFGYGATTTLTVVPDDHFHFIAWTDGDKANPRRLTVLGDAVYHAICAIDTLKVDTFAVHGYITGGGMYEYGSYVILEAIPFEGFKLDRWSDGSTYNPNVIFLENNITIGAYFVPIQEDLESMDTDGFSAYAVDKTLYVNNGNAPYTIINVNGRIVYQGRDAVVELPCGGIYVVLSGYNAIKVIAQ
ncbi:MAG: discoidin domain-containing protein, partial [Bacteroidales bacterium]|nr:discoidin domain-containing protein [Bacteroidales bacterium]